MNENKRKDNENEKELHKQGKEKKIIRAQNVNYLSECTKKIDQASRVGLLIGGYTSVRGTTVVLLSGAQHPGVGAHRFGIRA